MEELTEHQNGDIAFIKEKVIFLYEATTANNESFRSLSLEAGLAEIRSRKVEESLGSLYVKVDGLEQRF